MIAIKQTKKMFAESIIKLERYKKKLNEPLILITSDYLVDGSPSQSETSRQVAL